MEGQHQNLCYAMTNTQNEPLAKSDEDKVVGDLHIKQENAEDTTNNTVYNGLAIKQEKVNIKEEFFVSCAASETDTLNEPLEKLDKDKVVGELHVKQENAEDTTDNIDYHELAIKPEKVYIKDKLLVSCAASKSLSGEAFVSKVCEYRAEGNSNFLENVKIDMRQFHLCSICSYKTTSKYNLVNHIRTHTGEKPYICLICEYKTAHRSSLVRHMITHKVEKPCLKKSYSCSVCQYKAALKTDLLKHMRRHTGEKPYACSNCKYKAAQKGHLVNHMKTHTGEKPYSCTICKFEAAQRIHLVRHMRTHTGETPYSCLICDYKAAWEDHLVVHMKMHTGEKPYSCSICDYKTIHKHSLVAHMRTHTGEKPYACCICEYKAAEKSNLVKHMKKHT